MMVRSAALSTAQVRFGEPSERQDERMLVQRSRGGDEDAFAQLVMQNQSGIFALLLRMTRDQEEAVDLAQDTFLRAWRALPSFREEARFGTWLYRIAYNVCLNRRLVDRGDRAELELVETVRAPAGDEPSERFAQRERRELLARSIDRLLPRHKLVLHLFYWADLSYEEIASILRMPVGTVKTHLFRAKAELRAHLLASPETQNGL